MLFPNFCSEILRKALFLESHRNFLRVGVPVSLVNVMTTPFLPTKSGSIVVGKV